MSNFFLTYERKHRAINYQRAEEGDSSVTGEASTCLCKAKSDTV